MVRCVWENHGRQRTNHGFRRRCCNDRGQRSSLVRTDVVDAPAIGTRTCTHRGGEARRDTLYSEPKGWERRAMSVDAVSTDEVRRVAELAHLELSSEEETKMQRDLNAILSHIVQLNELDTRNIAPMAQVRGALGLLTEEAGEDLRLDQVRPSLDRKSVMASAPETDGRFFKVPKVIER